MSRFLIPNTTQVPNVLLDVVMREVSNPSLRVLLAIVRKTYGFQKQSDHISLTQLQEITGLSRQGVVNGARALGSLIAIRHGKREGNEYALNLNVATGELVNGVDQSTRLTSQRGAKTLVNGVDTQNQIRTKPNSVRKTSRSILANSKTQPAAGFKETRDLYCELFIARFGSKPDFDGGRDGAILSGLLKSHDAAEVKELLRFFFEHPPDWVEKKCKYTIPTFKSVYTELVAQSRNAKTQMGVL
jgi:phage replication O-like protein O